MKTVFTILFFILSISFSFGQVFFKQRVYGMENREPKQEAKIDFRKNKKYNSESVRRSKRYEYERNPSPYLWKDQPLKAITKKGLFVYTEEGNTFIQIKTASKMFRKMGETDLADNLAGISDGYAATTIVQFISVPSTMLLGSFVLAESLQEDEDSGTQKRRQMFRISLGTFVGTTLLKQIFKVSLKSTLSNYNSKLSFDKQFAPNFRPSKIAFKPIQISPFTPSLVPTLGLSWKL